MTRLEFYAAFREARKLRQLERTFYRTLPGGLESLMYSIPLAAYCATCRYGDALRWPHLRIDGRWRSRVR